MSTTPFPPPRPGLPEDTPASLRKAALCLHAMPAADREWVLARLDAADRAKMLSLVSELKALGFPVERAMLEEVIGQREPSREERLRVAEPTELADLLRREPTRLVAQVLQSGDWPWRDALLRRLGHEARSQVELALRDPPPVGERLRAALEDTLLQRLATRRHAREQRHTPRSWMSALFRRGARS